MARLNHLLPLCTVTDLRDHGSGFSLARDQKTVFTAANAAACHLLTRSQFCADFRGSIQAVLLVKLGRQGRWGLLDVWQFLECGDSHRVVPCLPCCHTDAKLAWTNDFHKSVHCTQRVFKAANRELCESCRINATHNPGVPWGHPCSRLTRLWLILVTQAKVGAGMACWTV